MAKYDPLRRFLRRRRQKNVRLSFDEIERIIGAFLPKAAHDPAWWSNAPPQGRGFVQCQAWLDAGYVAEPAGAADGVVFRHRAGDR